MVFLAGLALSQIPQSSEAESHLNLGLQLAQQGNLMQAESELRQAAQLAPADAQVLASFGTVLAMRKKLEESTSVFKQALELSPRDTTVRRYLAANLWQLQRFTEAKQNLEILLKQKPSDDVSRLLLGMVSENLKDYATAVRMLSSVPEQVRQQPESMAALARSYYHLGQTKQARATLMELSDHAAGGQQVLLGAQIANEMRDYKTAEALLLSIESKFPDPAVMGYHLALVQYHAGRFGDSKQTLLRYIAAGHASGQIYNLLGWCYYKQRQSKEAVQAFTQAIAAAPQDETNYRDLGGVLFAERSLPAALALAREATAAFPNSAPLFELQGSVESKMGQFADAVHSYSRATELEPSRADAALGLAQAQFSAGNSEAATASLDSAIKRFPKDPRFKATYASVLLKEAETGNAHADKRAEEMLYAALALDPSLPAAHYELGKLALEQGRLAEALEHLKKAVALDPQNSQAHFVLARAYRRAARNDRAAQEMDVFEKLKQAEAQAKVPAPESEKQDRF
jgi:tetratricopeptide (TPR) repeat protein